MKEKIPSFHFIYRPTFSDMWLQSNEGLISITHAPVLSNLKGHTHSVPLSLSDWSPGDGCRRAISWC